MHRIGYWAIGAAMVLNACSNMSEGCIMPDNLTLQEGDIVLRRGTGVVSRIVYTADIGGYYSHIGIVANTDSGLMVVHAVPNEPDDELDFDRVKIERPEKYFSTFSAENGAVVRVTDSKSRKVAAEYALEAAVNKVPFDHDYDDSDSTALYCCELVVRAYAKGGIDLAPAEKHSIKFPGVIDVECIFPSDIYRSNQVKLITQF